MGRCILIFLNLRKLNKITDDVYNRTSFTNVPTSMLPILTLLKIKVCYFKLTKYIPLVSF